MQLSVKKMGFLDIFFRVYASEDTKANFLCFADIEGMYDIAYVPKESFTVYLADRGMGNYM